MLQCSSINRHYKNWSLFTLPYLACVTWHYAISAMYTCLYVCAFVGLCVFVSVPISVRMRSCVCRSHCVGLNAHLQPAMHTKTHDVGEKKNNSFNCDDRSCLTLKHVMRPEPIEMKDTLQAYSNSSSNSSHGSIHTCIKPIIYAAPFLNLGIAM